MAKRVDQNERKRQVIERAIRLFSQVGYDNVSLIMIAQAAGVSRTVLYRLFCSKHEVLDEAILSVTNKLAQHCKRIIALRESPMAKLEKVCNAVVDVLFDQKAFVIAIFDYVIGMVRTGVDMNGNIHTFTAGTRNVLRLLIEHAKQRGEIADGLIVDRIADAIYAEFESCAMRIVLGTERDSTAAHQRFADVLRAISTWK